MKYMLTDPDTHIDFGFGLLASNFYNTADFLWENNPDKNREGSLPNLYLYRHSIELYLKSLIVIIHKKLKLNYKDGEVPYNSRKPYILENKPEGKHQWKELTHCHYISTLYYYFEKLVVTYEEKLQEKASQTLSVIINPGNQKIVLSIKEYDDRSTYFRYSDISGSKTTAKEKEKNYNKKVNLQDIETELDFDKPTSYYIISNRESGEVMEVHKGLREMPLKELAKDLRSFAEYLSGVHAMFRITLCDSY